MLFVVHISSDKGKEVEDADVEKVPSSIIVLGCISCRYFRVSISQGGRIFY